MSHLIGGASNKITKPPRERGLVGGGWGSFTHAPHRPPCLTRPSRRPLPPCTFTTTLGTTRHALALALLHHPDFISKTLSHATRRAGHVAQFVAELARLASAKSQSKECRPEASKCGCTAVCRWGVGVDAEQSGGAGGAAYAWEVGWEQRAVVVSEKCNGVTPDLTHQ